MLCPEAPQQRAQQEHLQDLPGTLQQSLHPSLPESLGSQYDARPEQPAVKGEPGSGTNFPSLRT